YLLHNNLSATPLPLHGILPSLLSVKDQTAKVTQAKPGNKIVRGKLPHLTASCQGFYVFNIKTFN
ncbi:hypothetical protein, partial [Spirochaeta dissipatitropha]